MRAISNMPGDFFHKMEKKIRWNFAGNSNMPGKIKKNIWGNFHGISDIRFLFCLFVLMVFSVYLNLSNKWFFYSIIFLSESSTVALKNIYKSAIKYWGEWLLQPRKNLSSSSSSSRGPNASNPALTAKLWYKNNVSFENEENNYIPIIRSPEPTMASARDTQSFQTAGGYIKIFLGGDHVFYFFLFPQATLIYVSASGSVPPLLV